VTTRIFLDASALFAAAYSATGASRELLRLGIEGRVRLFTNQTAVEEAERNLERKAPEGVAIFRALIAALPVEVLPPPSEVELISAATVVVLKDAPILAGAVGCRADFLATFDRQHLIGVDVLRLLETLVIATPGDILARLR
jgi:predicted nucleic acid-binding protein